MEAGTVTIALVPLTDRQAAYYETVIREHENRSTTGRCAVCGVPMCGQWVDAKAALAMGGREDWDPLRERARQRLWVATLDDR